MQQQTLDPCQRAEFKPSLLTPQPADVRAPQVKMLQLLKTPKWLQRCYCVHTYIQVLEFVAARQGSKAMEMCTANKAKVL